MQRAPLCPRFAEAWLNEPAGRKHVVLGRHLRPFCLWHRFLLEVADSPLLRHGVEPTHADLEEAVRICCSRYDAPLAGIFPAPPRTRLWRWLLTARGSWVAARYPLPAAMAAFGAYLRDYQSPPELWQETSAGGEQTRNDLPEVLGAVVQLIASGAFEERAAWEMPIGRTRWYGAGFAKMAGANIRFRTESDKLFDGLRKLQARYAAVKAARQKKQKPKPKK